MFFMLLKVGKYQMQFAFNSSKKGAKQYSISAQGSSKGSLGAI
jgi:hypothetical protein